MKRLFLFFCVLTSLSACIEEPTVQELEEQAPVPATVMEPFLKDLMLAAAMADLRNDLDYKEKVQLRYAYYLDILSTHELSDSTAKAALQYYAKQEALFKPMMQTVSGKLNKEHEVLQQAR